MSMDYTTMTEQELADLIDRAQDEILRRQNLEAVDREVAAVFRRVRESGIAPPPEPGAEWVQPTGAHDSYVAGDVVTHNSKTWVSTVSPNTWEPGVSGWHEQPTDGSVPEWVRPSGTHDAYHSGDHVMFEGTEYVSKIDNNTWSPIDYPDGWEKQ